MLIGSYNHTIDEKGRLFVPAKWREDLSPTFIVTKGTDKCLFGMSMQKWTEFSAKLATLPLTDTEAQEFVRHISFWATDCELDKQGRILLSAKQRAFAELETEVTLIGMTGRIELWNPEIWERHDAAIASNYDSILRKMAQLGI